MTQRPPLPEFTDDEFESAALNVYQYVEPYEIEEDEPLRCRGHGRVLVAEGGGVVCFGCGKPA